MDKEAQEKAPNPSGSGNVLDDARRHFEEGETEEALQLLQGLVEREPDNALAQQELARALLQLNRLQPAAKAARRALELDPKLYLPHAVLAWVAMAGGRFKEAEQEWQARIDASPPEDLAGKAAAYNQIAAIYYRSRRYDKAEELMHQAMELQPENLSMRANVAMLHLQLGQFKEAQAELERILAQPGVTERIAHVAYLNLGHLYARSGDYAKARELFTQDVEVHPSFLGRFYRAVPFLARFQPANLLRILVVIVALIVLLIWNLLLARR